MKTSTVAAIGGAALGVAGAAAIVSRRATKSAVPRAVVHALPGQLEFKELMPGVTRAVLWGDPDRGSFAAYLRFAPNVSHALHTHTNDVSGLVVSGAYIYRTATQEIRVGPGEYFFIPGGTPHASAGDPIEGALFYEQDADSFDINFIEKPGTA